MAPKKGAKLPAAAKKKVEMLNFILLQLVLKKRMKWRRVDLMVTSWLWNSISKEIVEAFMYGDLSLTAYWTKVKKLWNELNCLAPMPKCTCGGCTCGINKSITELNVSTQLMQFLMGIHDVFDSERSQVLMMDPLPDIEKAFSMFLPLKNRDLFM
ncbi:UNVERIFIED_CONTAM: hypothetical protein Scaly_2186600 [Sesamum calycinum]|uniref:Uncharacterized protein n=1 Tax=Sesamum calycinum TaxID=2727403 RepID=A0AAW2MP43_9LAMI